MNFAFTEEQDELRKTVRAFLDSKSPESAVREQMETEDGYDAAVWTQMAEQMGLQGLHDPRGVRRLGLQLTSSSASCSRRWAARCCARRSSRPSCWPPTRCSTAATTRPRRTHLPGIASGETIATVAFTEPSGKWDEAGITMEATADGDGWTLNGTKSFVLDGHPAEPDHRRRPHAARASACSPSTATRRG